MGEGETPVQRLQVIGVLADSTNRAGGPIQINLRALEPLTGHKKLNSLTLKNTSVTNDGLPIVLGVDGQTIGGYPQVAHVVRADLDVLGQLRPGDTVRFRTVTADERGTIKGVPISYPMSNVHSRGVGGSSVIAVRVSQKVL